MSNYVVAGQHEWNRTEFLEARLHHEWSYVSTPDALTAAALHEAQPRFVFFLHWSHRVPDDVVAEFECVNFHMTDLPEGRGGSPLQHLIASGATDTVLTAFRMTNEFDAGPIYLKHPLSLEGTAEAIYARSSRIALSMALEIARSEPTPHAQDGTATTTRRRKPADSDIRPLTNLDDVYDAIRMVDASGYPHAFLESGEFRYEFRRAARYGDSVEATVRITRAAQEGS